MGEVRVVNASPLITLAKVGRLDLLTRGGPRTTNEPVVNIATRAGLNVRLLVKKAA